MNFKVSAIFEVFLSHFRWLHTLLEYNMANLIRYAKAWGACDVSNTRNGIPNFMVSVKRGGMQCN